MNAFEIYALVCYTVMGIFILYVYTFDTEKDDEGFDYMDLVIFLIAPISCVMAVYFWLKDDDE